MNKVTETVRLTKLSQLSPLVLRVSALTDFLWPDFVRETKPQVKYFTERYNINQLSRFGMELFEFLYTGGDVKTIVDSDEFENYFRAKQNGENPEYPKGYKPENSFWNLVLDDIKNNPFYSELQELCTGSHFNSGNNAICILNELSNLLEDIIESSNAVLDALTTETDRLKEIRNEFIQAMKEGNKEKALELKKEGMLLANKIEETLSNAHEFNKATIDKSIQDAHAEAESLNDAMQALAGDNKGNGEKHNNIKEKQALAAKLRTNKRLLQLAKRIGSVKKSWNRKKRSNRHVSTYSDIVGAVMSDNVTKAFPSEIALAATEKGRALFALKHQQKTILTKDYESKTNELERGPVVMYIDISGSMSGKPEVWSKAIAYVISEECAKDKRDFQVHLFDTGIDQSITIKPHETNKEHLINFMLAWHTRGGTSFDQVMKHAYSRADIDERADILIITDGQCEVTEATVRKFNLFKKDQSLDVHAMCIGTKSSSLTTFCDTVNLVNISQDAESSELFQSVIS